VENIKLYSESILEQALKVFSDINLRINSLIDCSAKDFDTLNLSFREYHSTIKNLTENTNSLFNLIISLPDELIEQNLNLLKSIHNKFNNAYDHLLRIDLLMGRLSNESSYTHLHVNNLRQNICTLKLLATNLQLEPNFRNSYSDLIETISNLSNFSQKYDKEFQLNDKRIKAGIEITEQLKTQQYILVSKAIKKLELGLVNLNEKKSDCIMNNTLMHDLISKKSVSSSEIITNLQFQDIIRQKIEHVQHAHESLLEQLHDFYNNKKTILKQRPEVTLEIILQIRNIGSLQAAQLVHANSEYQKAIDTITSKFGDLDSILTETRQILGKFLPYSDSMKEYLYKDIEKGAATYELEFESFSDLNSSLNHMYTDLFRQDQKLSDLSNAYNNSLDKLNSIIEKLRFQKAEQLLNPNTVDTITQILANYNDFKKNTLDLNLILDKNKQEYVDFLQPTMHGYFKLLESIETDSINILSKIAGLIPEDIQKRTIEKKIFNEKELSGVKFNIGSTTYYEVFEKEVDVIIAGLNSLINQINFDEIENKVSTENLERLRKMYTMKSEREIHALFTGSKIVENEESSEIELF
jgi:hypothetical protein